MEDESMNSMMKRGTLSSNYITTHEDDDESPEESSWTMYLQDFVIGNNHGHDDENTCFSSFGSQNCPFISDAASSVTRNISSTSTQVLGFGVDGNRNINRSSFQFINRISKQALLNDDDDDEDALEDTATSPVHSPKVCNLSHSHGKPTLQKDEKGRSSGLADERNELGFSGRESVCTELKKRGLCLVPFSTVANYFG